MVDLLVLMMDETGEIVLEMPFIEVMNEDARNQPN